MKRPASQYYWGDWRRDTALQSCSLTARGLWHEMNCLMHDCEPYGHLTVGNASMQPAQLARLVGVTSRECAALLDELEAAGVFSRTDDGVIFSRRMVRDEDLRNRRASGGGAGAEFGILGAEAGKKGGRPKRKEGGLLTPHSTAEKPPPAFASASASAEVSTEDCESAERALAQAGSDGITPTPAGAACRAIKAAGVPDVNPGHPGLLRLLDAGVTAEALAATAAELVDRGKGKFALLLATHEGRLRDAATAGAVPVAMPAAEPPWRAEQRQQSEHRRAMAGAAAARSPQQAANFIDMEASDAVIAVATSAVG